MRVLIASRFGDLPTGIYSGSRPCARRARSRSCSARLLLSRRRGAHYGLHAKNMVDRGCPRSRRIDARHVAAGSGTEARQSGRRDRARPGADCADRRPRLEPARHRGEGLNAIVVGTGPEERPRPAGLGVERDRTTTPKDSRSSCVPPQAAVPTASCQNLRDDVPTRTVDVQRTARCLTRSRASADRTARCHMSRP